MSGTIHNVVGSVVEDADFFGRELEQLRKQSERQNVLVSAPRRVGKTSLLHRFARDLRRPSHVRER